MKPHKHAELIKAWADGSEIQISVSRGELWEDAQPNFLVWNDEYQYRIKPEEKKPVTHKELSAGNCFEITSKFGEHCGFKSNSVKKGDKVYTHPHKELSDEEIQKAFNQWLMLDEGFVRFDYQLKHEWVAEQWERWQQAFKLARGEE